ncbi:hypothetical protein [Streptomyces sp. NPDC047070]|uniref:hypothetical protein n=1 Tax=Streptomyces sp. NPDC047070 TaxID=3154923 RepID=UPI0034565443
MSATPNNMPARLNPAALSASLTQILESLAARLTAGEDLDLDALDMLVKLIDARTRSEQLRLEVRRFSAEMAAERAA